jgi:hypothetical protein
MKIEWTFSNVQDTVAKMGVKRDKILAASKRGLVKGMEYFMAKIILEQMGRHSNTSLGVRTGYLRRSWKVTKYDTNFGGISIVKLATDAPYAAVHQFGSRDWDGTFHGRTAEGRFAKHAERQVGAPKRHNVPKRLHVYEEFQTSGPALLQRSVRDEVAMLGNL